MSETEHTGTGTGTGRTGCICIPVPVCCVCLCACTCRSLQPTALSPERRACSVPPSCRHAGSHVGSCRPVARVIATPCVASGDQHDMSCVTCVDVVAHHAPCLHVHPCGAPPTCSSTSSGSSGASGVESEPPISLSQSLDQMPDEIWQECEAKALSGS